MAYMPHIENLYKNQTILLFKEVYALEKIHGTNAKLVFKCSPTDRVTWTVDFHSGGESHEKFVSLFDDREKLLTVIKDIGFPCDKDVTVYGEAYGGKQQGMSHTYGLNLKFIVFDIQVGENWLSVPDAEEITKKLGLEFVHYVKVSTDLKSLDEQRDAPSVQAVRNGITAEPKKREGVVLRPLMEMTLNNGERVISKHKGDDFKETATPRPVVDPSKLKALDDANAVANEWVTLNRLKNVFSHLTDNDISIENMGNIIKLMIDDIHREASMEVVFTKEIDKSISKKCVEISKNYFKSKNLFKK